MRRMHTRGLVAAMENEELKEAEGAPAADEQAVEVAEAGAELSDEIADVTEDEAVGEQQDEEVEQATEVAEALESIAESLGICAQNGGLDRYSADAVGKSVQALYNIVGVSRPAMPALESFGGVSSRVDSTKLAMEDIKEAAGKIWDKIVAAIKRAIQWAQDFFNKIFGAAEKLEKRADALQSKAEAITGSAKEKTFENPGLVKALHMGGKVGSIAADMGRVQALAKTVFADAKTMGAEVGQEIVDKMSKEGAEKDFVSTFELDAGGVVGKEVTNPEGAGFSAPVEGLALFRTDELPGGMAIIGRAPKASLKGEAAIEAIRGFGSQVGQFDPKAKDPSEKSVATLSNKDMVATCKVVADIAVQLRAYRNAQGKLNEMKKKFQAVAEKAQKNVSGAEGEARDGFKAMAKVASQMPRFIDQPASSFAAYVLKAGRSALDYVEASAKQYA